LAAGYGIDAGSNPALRTTRREKQEKEKPIARRMQVDASDTWGLESPRKQLEAKG
jgi:hypothetical protein